MPNWKNLPLELLSYIYSNLSERDLLACHLVCLHWRKALNTIYLWRSAIVRIDVDFLEPSKIILSRNYCQFVKNLEVGWEQPQEIYALRLRQHRNQTTKRVVRFFSTLYDNDVQIVSLRIFNWYSFTIFKKILYHICRFLKKQNRLERVAFDNITLKDNNYIALLRACLASKDTITSFDISDHFGSKDFEPIYLYSCVQQLSNLKTLKLGYRLFSTNTTTYIAENCNKNLENLEIVVDDWNKNNYAVHDEEWCQLKNALPKLVVLFRISDVSPSLGISYLN